MLGKQYNACSSALYNFLHFSCNFVSPSLKYLSKHFIVLFYPLKVREEVSHSYNTTCNMSLLYVIIIRMFCPMAGLSLKTQASRLPFCPMAGLPPQTQEPRLRFYRDEQAQYLPVAFRIALSL